MAFSDFVFKTAYANERLARMVNSEMQNAAYTLPKDGRQSVGDDPLFDIPDIEVDLILMEHYSIKRELLLEKLGTLVCRQGFIPHPTHVL